MQNTLHHRLGTALVLLGMASSTIGMQNSYTASLTGQGAITGVISPATTTLMEQTVVHAAAPQSTENTGAMIAFGVLMMLLGFGIHALIVLRSIPKQEWERHVPVHGSSSKKQQTSLQKKRTSRKQLEVIWVERTIRF